MAALEAPLTGHPWSCSTGRIVGIGSGQLERGGELLPRRQVATDRVGVSWKDAIRARGILVETSQHGSLTI